MTEKKSHRVQTDKASEYRRCPRCWHSSLMHSKELGCAGAGKEPGSPCLCPLTPDGRWAIL